MRKQKNYFLIAVLFLMTFLLIFPTDTEAATKAKLNKTRTTIYIGSTETLKVTGTRKKAKWRSSNEKIVTVNKNGKITPKKEGSAIVIARVCGKDYRCKVIVKKPSINAKKKTLEIGKTYTLKLTGTDIKSVKSSNKKVATVSKKGKVTAKKAGTATITLTGKNKKKYTCKITVKAHEHTWDEGRMTVFGNCGKDGLKTYTCTSCKKTKTEVIKATGKHDWNEGEITTEPTCAKEGVITYTCRRCQASKTGKAEKTTEHRWDRGKVTTEPTCTKEGVETYTCTECKTTKMKTIIKNGHDVSNSYIVLAKDSTCAETGYYNRICRACNAVIGTETIPKKELHTSSDWITDEEATCTTTGKHHKECLVCGEILETDIIEKTSHAYVWHTTKEPSITAATCEEDFGVRIGTCSCGESMEENIIRIDIGSGETKLMYGYFDDAMAMECLELINDHRINEVTSKTLVGDEWVEIDTPPLEIREREQTGAKIRAVEIAYYYSHTRPNSDRTLGEYFDNAENIASGPRTAFEAFDGWMRSSGHHGNIVRSSFEYTGIAVFLHDATNLGCDCRSFWVQGFSKDYSDIDFVK